jgi:hypothetical protein
MTVYISAPMAGDDPRKSVALYREVEPHLDLLFPEREFRYLEGGELSGDTGYIVLLTPALYVSITRYRGEDTLSFAPDEASEKRGGFSVESLRWLLGEHPAELPITDQLRWLEQHPAWWKRWQSRAIYVEYQKLIERRGPLLIDFTNKFLVGPGNALWEVQPPSPPLPAPSEELAKSALFHRASGYLTMILGETWQAHLDSEVLYVVGERFSLRIEAQAEGEVLSVGPSSPNLDGYSPEPSDWLAVRRATQTLVRDSVGSSLESQLNHLATYVGNYTRICRPESFRKALSFIVQAEAIHAELVFLITGGLEG